MWVEKEREREMWHFFLSFAFGFEGKLSTLEYRVLSCSFFVFYSYFCTISDILCEIEKKFKNQAKLRLTIKLLIAELSCKDCLNVFILLKTICLYLNLNIHLSVFGVP